MRTLLVDADVLVYRFAHSEEVVVQWTRDLYTAHGELEPAKLHFMSYVKELLARTECEEPLFYLSDADANFRKEIPLVNYKQNRLGTRRPVLWKPLRDWIQNEHLAYHGMAPRLEGDDLLGLAATELDGDFIIATIDKDLDQIPGLHYNWDKFDLGVYEVTKAEGERFFYKQALMGDRVDGYDGCPGIGPKRADKILGDCEPGEEWEAIVAAYEKAGLNESVALANARCARILRAGEYDWNTNTVRLWTPPTGEN